MLDKQKDIDGVLIATPDHTHAIITLESMKRGKHVYTEKPLTHSVQEARILTRAAKKYKVATQMGNSGQAGDGPRRLREMIWDGAIGPVREVHSWVDQGNCTYRQYGGWAHSHVHIVRLVLLYLLKPAPPQELI